MGIMIFVGTFVGLVFLIATGSIIYFKQLSEANADKAKYNILRKVGVTPKKEEGGWRLFFYLRSTSDCRNLAQYLCPQQR
ncbi:hypothetical protein P7H12_13755 [Paenibacillus larvae]|nr:hypothetical protein [Paenibacillus larvae]MDT2264426.1 hypothetical protein [Paenibacillus larvae]